MKTLWMEIFLKTKRKKNKMSPTEDVLPKKLSPTVFRADDHSRKVWQTMWKQRSSLGQFACYSQDNRYHVVTATVEHLLLAMKLMTSSS